MTCIFCSIEKENFILQNERAYAIYDKYPHSKGHLLIIPFKHCESFFECEKKDQDAMIRLLNEAKNFSDKLKPVAYNVNINSGKAAGQVVMHAHIHLIPRY